MENRFNKIEEKINELESNQIQQNRNIVSIVKNVVEYGFDESDKEKRKAAWVSLGGYFFRQRVLIIITSILTCLLSIASIYIAYTANQLIGEQNILIKEEFKLVEAERRSSLIFLMSNVMDKLYEEVEEQRKNLEDRENIFSDKKYNLSPSLMGRIVGLSRAFKPYHVLENGELSEDLISPERGQIIVTLLNSKINNNSLHYMFARGDFSYADLDFSNNELNPFQIDNQSLNLAMFQNVVMKNISIENTNCPEIQLNGSTLEKIYFSGCNLSQGNFSDATIEVDFLNCNLIEANFTNSDLQNTSFDNSCLCNADFANARNLKVEQFQKVRSLYGVKNLPKEIEEQLDKTLFGKSKCNGWKCIF